jgi:hypothetical protein
MGRAVSFSLPFRRRGLFFDDRRRRIVFSNDTNTPSQQYPIANTIMKLALFCSLAVSAAAFAPASTTRQSSTLSASFENELGAQKPVSERIG